MNSLRWLPLPTVDRLPDRPARNARSQQGGGTDTKGRIYSRSATRGVLGATLLCTACSLITSVDRTLIEDPQPPRATEAEAGTETNRDGGRDGGPLVQQKDGGTSLAPLDSGTSFSGDPGALDGGGKAPGPNDGGRPDGGESPPMDAGLRIDAGP